MGKTLEKLRDSLKDETVVSESLPMVMLCKEPRAQCKYIGPKTTHMISHSRTPHVRYKSIVGSQHFGYIFFSVDTFKLRDFYCKRKILYSTQIKLGLGPP